MRSYFLLCRVPMLALPVLVLVATPGCGLLEYMSSPEGQRQGGDALKAGVGVAANPANPLAWLDLVYAGGTLFAGYVAWKGGGKAVGAMANVVKTKVINPGGINAITE